MAMDPQTANREHDKFYQDTSGNTVVRTGFGDTSFSDAFGRLRVSNTGQRLDVEFLYDKQTEYFDETTSNGTVTHNANSRDLTLSISDANDGTHATMSSYPVPYTPGNSQLVEMTGVLDLAAIGGGTASVFLRTSTSGSVVEETYNQSTWDNLTGANDIDFTKAQLFSIDFQSLKVGRLRFGMFQNGIYVPIKEILNDNEYNVGQWELANLPVTYKVRNDATNTYLEIGYFNGDNGAGFRYTISANASATLKAICCTVKSEGGPELRDLPGLPRSTDNALTAVTVSTTLVPVLSIKSKTTFGSLDNLILSIPKGFSVETDEAIKVEVRLNGTLTNDSFADVDANGSCIQKDVSATAITGGTIIYSEYIYATGSGPAATRVISNLNGLLGKDLLWNRLSSLTGILSICAIRSGASNASVKCALNWEELR